MITIYGTAQCGFCHDAVNLAKRYGFPYEYKDIGLSKYYRQLRSENVDMQKIPHIWWNDKYIGHYRELHEAIQNYHMTEDTSLVTPRD
jgi:glutaredoxin